VVDRLPITLEGVRLALQNAERLFKDSQLVCIPTRVALLEIGLEEIAKTWGILLGYEINLLDNDPEFHKMYYQSAHFVRKSLNKIHSFLY